MASRVEVDSSVLPGERKPVLIDARSPALLRVFVNLLEQKGEVMVSEMLPSPGQLWLGAEGGRHTAEWSCCFLWGTESHE